MADDSSNLPAPADNAGLRALVGGVQIGGNGIAPKTLAELMDFAQLMAKAGPMIGKAFRNNPGACVAITMQSMSWGMSPFAVSQKAYVTNDSVAYEAQLVTAVINAHAPIVERPQYEFTGEGTKRRCAITATLRGDTKPSVYTSPEVGQITTKNSPLWKTDQDQQLGYYSIRAWARRYCPEIIMGVYTPEEMQEAQAVTVERSETVSVAASQDGGTMAASAEMELSDDTGIFLSGEPKDLVVNEYTARMAACNSDGDLAKVWAKFERIYFNGKTKRVSQNTYDGLAFILDQQETRIANQNLDLGRTGDSEDGDADESDETNPSLGQASDALSKTR